MSINLIHKANTRFPLISAARYHADLKTHPQYPKAKFGAIETAAKSVVNQTANKKFMEKLQNVFDQSSLDDAVVVAPYKENSKNLLSRIFAVKVSKHFGFDIDTEIVQLDTDKKMQHCGKIERLLNNVAYAGDVRTDKPYIIVDDNVTSGQTTMTLKSFIEKNGGTVKYAVSLSSTDGEDIDLSIDQSAIEQLRKNVAQSLQMGEKSARKFLEKAGINIDSFSSLQADYFNSGRGQKELATFAKQITAGNTRNFRPT